MGDEKSLFAAIISGEEPGNVLARMMKNDCIN